MQLDPSAAIWHFLDDLISIKCIGWHMLAKHQHWVFVRKSICVCLILICVCFCSYRRHLFVLWSQSADRTWAHEWDPSLTPSMASGGTPNWEQDWYEIYYKDYHLPLSILQLDPADRAVLRIAGGCHVAVICISVNPAVHNSCCECAMRFVIQCSSLSFDTKGSHCEMSGLKSISWVSHELAHCLNWMQLHSTVTMRWPYGTTCT